jgi:hypothetical protein
MVRIYVTESGGSPLSEIVKYMFEFPCVTVLSDCWRGIPVGGPNVAESENCDECDAGIRRVLQRIGGSFSHVRIFSGPSITNHKLGCYQWLLSS